MADGAHDMNLSAFAINRAAHGLAIYRQTFVVSAVLLAPVLQLHIPAKLNTHSGPM